MRNIRPSWSSALAAREPGCLASCPAARLGPGLRIQLDPGGRAEHDLALLHCGVQRSPQRGEDPALSSRPDDPRLGTHVALDLDQRPAFGPLALDLGVEPVDRCEQPRDVACVQPFQLDVPEVRDQPRLDVLAVGPLDRLADLPAAGQPGAQPLAHCVTRQAGVEPEPAPHVLDCGQRLAALGGGDHVADAGACVSSCRTGQQNAPGWREPGAAASDDA
jgi:hypothetical protein